jgi:hypothetical protein
MAFSIETVGRLFAAGRNLGNQAIGIAVGAGLATAAQQQSFVDSLDQIWKGAQMIYQGGSSLYALGIVVLGPPLGWFFTYVSQRSAKTDNQAAAVHAAVADPNTMVSAETQKSIIQTTASIAQSNNLEVSKDAKVVLLDATAALPEVVGDIKVVDPDLAAATASPQVKTAA